MKDSARWQQIEDLFHAALERAPDQRAAFLADACGEDSALHAEVTSLLTAHEQSSESTMSLPGQMVRQAALQLGAERPAGLNSGQTLSHYQIISLLGKGGMGEVYLAEDTLLGRRVALKLLPAEFTNDAERLRRFEREARATAALNHPNIVTIHEIGQHEHIHFIVTEFVSGQTLRQRMAAAVLPSGVALEFAMQIADALQAAHEAGVIHRDLKPENVMVRPDGRIKVLDFGLARLERRVLPPADSQSPTQPLVATTPGVVMGTPQYMSPEQARGQRMDARTDIFSLGVVLYEMLAGQAPFTGATPSDAMAALLTFDPPPLITAPPALQSIISKTLRKDREERYQTSNDLLLDLKKLSRDWESARPVEQSAAAVTDERERNEAGASVVTQKLSAAKTQSTGIAPSKRGAVIALSVVIMGVLGVWLYRRFEPAAVNPAAPFQTMRLQRITTNGRIAHEQAVISPDGKYLVYVVDKAGQQSLWMKQMVTNANVRIAPPAEIVYAGLTISHDSDYLYYVTQDTALFKVALVGGTPRKVLADVASGLSLSPDDRQIAFVRNDPGTGESMLMVAHTDGTGARKITARLFPDQISWPVWSPSQESIAFVSLRNSPNSRYAELIRVSVADGKEQLLSKRTWGYAGQMAWLPDGTGLLVNAADHSTRPPQIWQVLLARDEVRKITNDLNNYSGLSLTAEAKALVTIQTEKTSKLWLLPQGDANQARQIIFGGGKYEGVMGLTWTQDNRIIYSSSATSNPDLESGDPDLWIMQSEGSQQAQLTFNSRTNIRPVMTRDGRYIIWASNRAGRPNIWRMNADGSNPVQLTSGVDDVAPDCSPDGRWVVYQGIKDSRTVLWKVSMDGGESIPLTRELGARPVISPDGQWIACYYYDPHANPQRWQLAILPFAGGVPARLIDLPATADRLIPPRWTPDGQAVTYADTRSGVSNLWRQPTNGSAPQQVTNFKSDLIFNFAWSPDGRQLVCARGSINHDVVQISDFR